MEEPFLIHMVMMLVKREHCKVPVTRLVPRFVVSITDCPVTAGGKGWLTEQGWSPKRPKSVGSKHNRCVWFRMMLQ